MGQIFPPISIESRCLWFLKVNNYLAVINNLEFFFVKFYNNGRRQHQERTPREDAKGGRQETMPRDAPRVNAKTVNVEFKACSRQSKAFEHFYNADLVSTLSSRPLCGLFTPEIRQSPRPGSQSFPLFLIFLFHSGHGFIKALRWYEIKICLRKWFATIFFKETSWMLFNRGKPLKSSLKKMPKLRTDWTVLNCSIIYLINHGWDIKV